MKSPKITFVLLCVITIFCVANLMVSLAMLNWAKAMLAIVSNPTMSKGVVLNKSNNKNALKPLGSPLETSELYMGVGSKILWHSREDTLGKSPNNLSLIETYYFPEVKKYWEIQLNESEKTTVTHLLNGLDNWESMGPNDKKALADQIKSHYIYFITEALDIAIDYEFIEKDRDFFIRFFSSILEDQCSDNKDIVHTAP